MGVWMAPSEVSSLMKSVTLSAEKVPNSAGSPSVMRALRRSVFRVDFTRPNVRCGWYFRRSGRMPTSSASAASTSSTNRTSVSMPPRSPTQMMWGGPFGGNVPRPATSSSNAGVPSAARFTTSQIFGTSESFTSPRNFVVRWML